MNLLTTALLRLRTGNPTADLSATVVVHEQPVDSDRHDVDLASEMIRKSVVFRSFSFPVVTSLIVAGFVLFPVAERTCQAKTLQLMTGMSGSAYWGSNLMFDLVVYWVIWIFAAMVVVQYVELFIDSIRTSLLILSGLTGAYERDEQVTLDYVYMMLPPYAFPSCLIKILKLEMENRVCLRHRHSIIKAKCKNLRNEMWGHMLYCCSTTEEESDYWSAVHPLGFSQRGVGYEVIVMAIEGTLLFLLLSWLDSGSLPISEAYDPDKHKANESLDRDVMAEKDTVRNIVSKKMFSKAALTVEDLHKKFATVHAVKGLSFTVLSKECFGFLGSNGAGKTTAFQMLAALIPASRGEAYMRRCILSWEARKWQSKVGYCPQYGGLLETLTAREYLRLFASLRGVSTHKIDQLVESIFNLMGLDGIADNRCGTYSGGNKRKLSMAVAIIGLPRLVLLDEPTAGVDVVARRRMLSGLKVVMDYSDMSVVLTSQKMDECETACDRIGIVLAGQFRCLGTLQHLKDKYGTGSTIKLKLQSRDAQLRRSVEDAIVAQFPGIQLMDFHQGIFVFRLEEKLPWSVLFSKMLELQSQFVFEYVLVSDTTLEQIFINFARSYEKEERGKTAETSS
ncbi:ATP-binding cassette sub-family A member 17-like [Ixodes scapularis]|uniref:ATP-binding cassette sub-family A member 17-like n=1 Tax=Ixodes scapularis TaxID=6945 RepID=UPI001C3952C2|nr:ATP-binding cassette sub-family A member 17-like [Ixodes scapularis]